MLSSPRKPVQQQASTPICVPEAQFVDSFKAKQHVDCKPHYPRPFRLLMINLTLSVDLGGADVEKVDLRLPFMLAKFFPVVPDMQWLLLVSVSV